MRLHSFSSVQGLSQSGRQSGAACTPADGAGPEGEAAEDPEAGFTLLEILVVIVILGLLIGLVAPAVLRQLGGARVSVARQSIERLGAVLDLYKLDIGSYPSTDQGLQALSARPGDVSGWNGPYLKGDQVPLDAWNHAYIYRNPSSRSGHDYDLCSRGPDAQGAAQGSASSDQGLICNP
jgi:general secretion pathway protein G